MTAERQRTAFVHMISVSPGEHAITVRESRAGDDFHLLWAARRALALLDPQSGVTLVRLEGLNPADIPDDDVGLLGCDLSEYYGGRTLAEADKLRLIQLKYSVRHPDQKWTAARLTAKKRQYGASVIKRLAEMFHRVGQEMDAEQRMKRVTVALVSNQLLDPDLEEILTKAKNLLEGRPPGTGVGVGLKKLTGTARNVIDTLRNASGLRSGDFCDFIRAFDTSGCGADSRAMQTLALGHEASRLVVGQSAIPSLLELMRQQMLPETEFDSGLARTDIIVALGASSERALFPFPSRAVQPQLRIETNQAAQLAIQIGQSAPRILAHGGPGVGKTTTLLGLQDQLPPGSVVVMFDCYANGEYTNRSEDRHTSRALIQVANDVALRAGVLPVVVPDVVVPEDVLWRRFEETVAAASATLADGAFLVLAIDAADNAVMAAQRVGARPFVHDLWRIHVPSNVRVVMTARSGRRADVTAEVEGLAVQEVQLPAFDENASALMLRSSYPEASDEDCEQFHRRSRGIARVQAYALRTGEPAAHQRDTLDTVLSRARKGLPQIFDDVITTALSTVHNPRERRRRVAVLAAMARPAKAKTLAALLGGDDQVQSLLTDMSPALRTGPEGVGYADEDFEHHIIGAVTPDELKAAHAEFADYFTPIRNHDADAASRLAEHLFYTGRYQPLMDLVLNEGPPRAIEDGFLRAQTYRSRTSLALRIASNVRNEAAGPADVEQARRGPADVVKLLIAAADAARTNSSQITTVREAPDLAALYADPAAVATILLQDDNVRWRGRLHVRAAALLATHPDRSEEAKEQLDLATAWLQAWARSGQNISQEFNAADVARMALATFLLQGTDASVQFVQRWRPAAFVQEVSAHLFALAPRDIPIQKMRDGLLAARASTLMQAHATASYAAAGVAVPATWVQEVAARLDRLPRKQLRQTVAWSHTFCELALRCRVSRRRVRRILTRLGPVFSDHFSDWDAASALAPPLRTACLDAALGGTTLDAEDLLPASLQPPAQEQKAIVGRRDQQRSTFLLVVRDLLPLLSARAECVVAASTAAPATAAASATKIAEVVRSHLNTMHEGRRWAAATSHLLREWLAQAADALAAALHLQPAPEHASQSPHTDLLQALTSVINAIDEAGMSAAFGLRIQIAENLIRQPAAGDHAVDLLMRTADIVDATQMPASEKRDILLRAAAAALSVAPDVASDLFERAVAAAGGIDADIGPRLRMVTHIAAGAAASPHTDLSVPQRRELAHAITEMIERATPFVDQPEERLPHGLALMTASELHAPTGCATAVRWFDEDRTGLTDSLSLCLPASVRTGYLTARDAFWLLRIFRHGRGIMPAARAILSTEAGQGPNQRADAARKLTVLAEWIARDFDSPFMARSFVTLAEDLQLDGLDCVREMRQRGNLLELVQAKAEYTSPTFQADRTDRQQQIEQLIAAARIESLDVGLGQLDEVLADRQQRIAYLTAAARSTSATRRVQALEKLAELVDQGVRGARAADVAHAVRTVLHEWRSSARVREWANDRLPAWLRRHLPALLDWTTDLDGHSAIALTLPDQIRTLRQAVIDGVSTHLDTLAAQQLYALAQALAEALDSGHDHLGVVRWALANGPTEATTSTHSTTPSPESPEDPYAILAAMLWALLGHEDHRMRWRAMHAARLLLSHGSNATALAKELWNLRDATDQPGHPSGAFRASNREFFSRSALQSLLIVLARVAHTDPARLQTIVEELTACALDKEYPHAAVRELARQAATAVHHAHPAGLSPVLADQLPFANTPNQCSTDRESHRTGQRDPGTTRFDFDYLDTVPYWLEPLARVFHGLTTAEIARRADTWISEKWARTNQETRDDPRPGKHDRSWQLTRNDHGAIPVIETLHTYLEYHALLVTGGELSDEEAPVKVSRGHDPIDPWQQWLQHYLPHSPRVWLAERRRAVPLHALARGAWTRLGDSTSTTSGTLPAAPSDGETAFETSNKTQSALDAAAVARLICGALRDLSQDADMIVVTAAIDVTNDGWTCGSYLTSALVTPESSRSLLAALAAASRPYNMPAANTDGYPDDNEVDVDGMQLRGWITEIHNYPGLDQHDPLANNTGEQRDLPVTAFLRHARLVEDQTGTRFVGPDDVVGAEFVCWSDEDRYDRRGGDAKRIRGSYLVVRRDLLNAYLRDEDMSLMMSAHARFYPTADYKSNESHESFRYWTIHSDGTEETVHGFIWRQSDED